MRVAWAVAAIALNCAGVAHAQSAPEEGSAPPTSAASQPAPTHAARPEAPAQSVTTLDTDEPQDQTTVAVKQPVEAYDDSDPADPRPGDPMALYTIGALALLVGAGSAIYCDLRDVNQHCSPTLVVLSFTGALIGAPCVLIAWTRERKLNEWKRRHAITAQLLNTHLSADTRSLELTYTTSF